MSTNETTFSPLLTLLFSAATLVLLLDSTEVSAQVVSEQQAATETEIQNLRLLESAYGISFAFVENDTSPGGGKYLCGGMTANAARTAATVARNAFAKLPAPALAKAQLKYIEPIS